jgi:hypothetical protein
MSRLTGFGSKHRTSSRRRPRIVKRPNRPAPDKAGRFAVRGVPADTLRCSDRMG